MMASPPQTPRHEPLYDVHPQAGVSFEVFYSDRTLETFGRGALVGSGGRDDMGARQTVWRLVRSPRARRHTDMR
jgi:hypothetical protein